MTQKKGDPEVEGQNTSQPMHLAFRIFGGIGAVIGLVGLVASSSVYLWADYEKYVYRLLIFAIYVLIISIAAMILVKRRTVGTMFVVAIFAAILIVPLNLVFSFSVLLDRPAIAFELACSGLALCLSLLLLPKTTGHISW